MLFRKITIMSELNPKEELVTYFESICGKYQVQQSVRNDFWLAFFRPNKDDIAFSLIDLPVSTKKEATELCKNHSINLPW